MQKEDFERLYTHKYGSYLAQAHGYAAFRNNLRLNKLISFIDPSARDHILEIGCNDGLFTRRVAESGADVTGVDVNRDAIEALHDKRFRVMSGTDLSFKDGEFDKVYSFEVVEHIPEIEKYFSEVYRVLKKGGKLIISFPFEIIRGQSAVRDSLRIYGNIHYSRKLHVHKLSPRKIQEIISDIPFTVVSAQLCFIPFPSYVMVLKKE